MELPLNERLKVFIKSKYPKATGFQAMNIVDVPPFGHVAEVGWTEPVDGKNMDFESVVLMPKNGKWSECQDMASAIQNVALKSDGGAATIFNQTIGVHGILAILLVCTICYIAFANVAVIAKFELPGWLLNPLMVILGFYFGQVAPKSSS
jgi:hypothetical protein